MKRLIDMTVLALLLPFMLTFYSCGGGGGSSPAPANAPGISNLQYSPNTVVQNAGGGSIPVTGTVDFIDIDGNISTLTITIYDSLGNQIASNTTPITGISGHTSGTFSITVIANTTVIGNYTFKIHIIDSTGLQSNLLTGTFSVTSSLPIQVFAVDGLFLNSDNLLTASLSSSPFLVDNTVTGPTNSTNNIGSATFTASPPDLTARNIGLQFPAATQMNTLDIWVFSVTGATIDTAVPAYLPDPVAGAITWAVYTSSDGSNWQLFQTGVPYPYVLDVSRPGVGRFEITFPNAVTKYIKVVVSPLSPFAAGGQANDFPGIYVTELQAFNTTPAANVTGTTTSTTETGTLAASNSHI